MGALVFFLFVAIIVAVIMKSMMGGHGAGLETVHKTNTATGAAVATETASGASVATTEKLRIVSCRKKPKKQFLWIPQTLVPF